MLDLDLLKLFEKVKKGVKTRGLPIFMAGLTMVSVSGCSTNDAGVSVDEQIAALIEENQKLREQNEILVDFAESLMEGEGLVDVDVQASAIAGAGTNTTTSTNTGSQSSNNTSSNTNTQPSTPAPETGKPEDEPDRVVVDLTTPECPPVPTPPAPRPEEPQKECFYYGSQELYAEYISDPMVLTSSDGMTTTSDTYREILCKGVKYLVNSSGQVVLAGYDDLGTLFYLKYYDPNYGGIDSSRGIPGYVVRTYENDGTFSCYDADTFTPVLSDCDTYGVIDFFYIEAYDPDFGGRDNDNNGGGWVYVIHKGGMQFMVDANDFSRVLECGFTDFTTGYDDNGRPTVTFNYSNGYSSTYRARDFKSYRDDILAR